MVKNTYVEPAMEIISLATMQETLQATSGNATGGDVNFEDSLGFDDYFNVL